MPKRWIAWCAAAARLARSTAQVIIGPRGGSKSHDFRIPEGLAPGALAALVGLRVRSVESLRPGLAAEVAGAGLRGRATRWREQVEPAAGTEVLARFADESPALLRRGRARYVAGCFDAALLCTVIEGAAQEAGLATEHLHEGLRLRRCELALFPCILESFQTRGEMHEGNAQPQSLASRPDRAAPGLFFRGSSSCRAR